MSGYPPHEMVARVVDEYGGYWGECPRFPVSDWQYEVAEQATRQGYWEWVTDCLENERTM